ncbi:LysR family transcriptional regulator, partial [Streptomyces botrytidirepellens]
GPSGPAGRALVARACPALLERTRSMLGDAPATSP